MAVFLLFFLSFLRSCPAAPSLRPPPCSLAPAPAAIATGTGRVACAEGGRPAARPHPGLAPLVQQALPGEGAAAAPRMERDSDRLARAGALLSWEGASARLAGDLERAVGARQRWRDECESYSQLAEDIEDLQKVGSVLCLFGRTLFSSLLRLRRHACLQ